MKLRLLITTAAASMIACGNPRPERVYQNDPNEPVAPHVNGDSGNGGGGDPGSPPNNGDSSTPGDPGSPGGGDPMVAQNCGADTGDPGTIIDPRCTTLPIAETNDLTPFDQDCYRFDVAEAGALVANTSDAAGSCVPGMNTVIRLFGDNLTLMGENYFGVDAPCARMERTIAPGTYRLCLASFDGSEIQGVELSVQWLPAPTNDACGDAIDLGTLTDSSPMATLGHNIGATDDRRTRSFCQNGLVGHPDVFYSFTTEPGPRRAVQVDLEQFTWFQPVAYVFPDSCGSTPVDDDLTCMGQNEEGHSRMMFMADGGRTYYVAVDGDAYSFNAGTFDLTVQFAADFLLGGETCADAEPLPAPDGQVSGDFSIGVDDYAPDTHGCQFPGDAGGYDKVYAFNLDPWAHFTVRFDAWDVVADEVVSIIEDGTCPAVGNLCVDHADEHGNVGSPLGEVLTIQNDSSTARGYLLIVDEYTDAAAGAGNPIGGGYTLEWQTDACAADCAGRNCGDDGCGGECGTCQMGWECNPGGVCEEGCTPQCDGRECGFDGCGGFCGYCSMGEVCKTASGQCEVPTCTDNGDSCTAGWQCCSVWCSPAGTCATCSPYLFACDASTPCCDGLTCQSGTCRF